MREITVSSSERDRILAINALVRGRSNAVGRVTLLPGVSSTTVTRNTATANSEVFLSPRTGSAATELASGAMHWKMADAQTLVITHSVSAQADREFGFVILGG